LNQGFPSGQNQMYLIPNCYLTHRLGSGFPINYFLCVLLSHTKSSNSHCSESQTCAKSGFCHDSNSFFYMLMPTLTLQNHVIWSRCSWPLHLCNIWWWQIHATPLLVHPLSVLLLPCPLFPFLTHLLKYAQVSNTKATVYMVLQ
jgi:hypothetical protein